MHSACSHIGKLAAERKSASQRTEHKLGFAFAIAEVVYFSTINLCLVLPKLLAMCLTDEVLSAFPRTVGGGEALPPSSCGDLSGNLLEGKWVEKSQSQELKDTALFSVFHSSDI